MTFPCHQSTGHLRMKGICKLNPRMDGGSVRRKKVFVFTRPKKNYRPRCLAEACLRAHLTGCFPPKPPVRLLMHSDHRRQPYLRQEYVGNKREILLQRSSFTARQPQGMRRLRWPDSGINPRSQPVTLTRVGAVPISVFSRKFAARPESAPHLHKSARNSPVCGTLFSRL